MPERVGIRRLRLIDGARQANGAAVIIDVLRAATSVAYAIDRGAARVVLVDTATRAKELRAERYRGALLAGESGGRQLEGFDFDNSPTVLEHAALQGKTLIVRTSSGTQGVLAARGADAIFLAGFVNAGATARALRTGSRVASLVAMGTAGEVPAEEDEACAAYIESVLRGRPLAAGALLADVRARLGGDHPAPTWPEDVDRCLVVDRFDFAVIVRIEDGVGLAEGWTR